MESNSDSECCSTASDKNFFSSAVQIKYTERKGRHLIAVRDIAPGELLISESPFAFCKHRKVQRKDQTGEHRTAVDRSCDWCFQPKPKYEGLPWVQCDTCTDEELFYCSPECRAASWHQHHRFECGAITDLINETSVSAHNTATFHNLLMPIRICLAMPVEVLQNFQRKSSDFIKIEEKLDRKSQLELFSSFVVHENFVTNKTNDSTIDDARNTESNIFNELSSKVVQALAAGNKNTGYFHENNGWNAALSVEERKETFQKMLIDVMKRTICNRFQFSIFGRDYVSGFPIFTTALHAEIGLKMSCIFTTKNCLSHVCTDEPKRHIV